MEASKHNLMNIQQAEELIIAVLSNQFCLVTGDKPSLTIHVDYYTWLKLYDERDLESTSRMPVALTWHLQVLQHK